MSINFKRIYLFNCYILLTLSTLINAQDIYSYGIEGRVQLDTVWKPKIYLSHISDFSKMYTMSKSMIIAESKVDSLGNFYFKTDFLPEENMLYRIHVSKKGSSEASIIIGGKDENHFFIVANKKSNIKILNNTRVFNDVTFLKDNKNQIISKIDGIVKLIDSTNFSATRIKSEFVSNAFNEQLRQIADTCSFSLVSLYALQKSKYTRDVPNNLEYYQKFINKWKNENSVYFNNFKAKIPKIKTKIDNRWLIGFGLIASFIMGYIFNDKTKKRKTKEIKSLKTLSIQERKIFVLLKEGKSNKDIAEELNIGVSTVKSHVSNIYSKVSVKSRKEILDIDI